MRVFADEAMLVDELEKHDEYVRRCVDNQMSLEDFLKAYDNFFHRCALDGHESDADELLLFQKHAARIALHRAISDDIICHLCSEDDARKQQFKDAGFFGVESALAELRVIAIKIR